MAKGHEHILVTELQKHLRAFVKSVVGSKVEDLTFGFSHPYYKLNHFGFGSNVEYEGRNEILFPLHSFIQTDGLRCDFAASITLKFPQRGQIPSEVSIKFFTAINKDFKLAFRAEYSLSEAANHHSQPHWHFHFDDEEKIPSSFEDAEFESPVFTLNTDLKSIHFPIDWKLLFNKKQLQWNAQSDVIEWIKWILTYIQDQIKYAYGK